MDIVKKHTKQINAMILTPIKEDMNLIDKNMYMRNESGCVYVYKTYR